ncbi:hypothetical protein [Streptomyces sp. NPDC001020]
MVDVRPDDRIEPDDAAAFAATARAYELAGWAFRRVGSIDPVLLANVKWPAMPAMWRLNVFSAALATEWGRAMPALVASHARSGLTSGSNRY